MNTKKFSTKSIIKRICRAFQKGGNPETRKELINDHKFRDKFMSVYKREGNFMSYYELVNMTLYKKTLDKDKKKELLKIVAEKRSNNREKDVENFKLSKVEQKKKEIYDVQRKKGTEKKMEELNEKNIVLSKDSWIKTLEKNQKILYNNTFAFKNNSTDIELDIQMQICTLISPFAKDLYEKINLI